ncbi:MAG: penicillin-binding transpeptidase domain-containing protein [Prevotella sp.]|jgi:penicillin-binding protein 2
MNDFDLGNRKYVIGGAAVVIVTIYIIRLFTLQLVSDDYRKSADSNAFLKKVEYPSRGVIRDRNGKLLVYNQPSYDIMVVINETRDRIDTLDFCQTLGITKEYFIQRMHDIKDRSKNPGYSRFTQQLFMTQVDDRDFSVFQEKMYRFPGFYAQKRAIRKYEYPHAAHVLGDVAEVSQGDIDDDDYYQPGDYIGKSGVERSYEKQLRGEKGVRVLLRDAHGRIQGKYQEGKFDHRPKAGKDLTLGIDINLQALGERLLEGKIGAIVAIDPQTGEVLCMVSSPSYDPRMLEGKKRSKAHRVLSRDPWKPLLNRAIMGQYPPGSTFKTSQGLTFLSEGIINSHTQYPCHRGFYYRGLHVGCHGHASPLSVVPALSTSCNAFFCWGLYHMMGNRRRYKNVQEAMNTWRDYMVSMGFGYRLGIDIPGEKRGLIPNAEFYDKAYRKSWNGLTVISISIGQGEVNLTPLQIANLGATIANRGYYYIPHVVRKVQDEPLDTVYTRRHYTRAARRAYDLTVAGMRSSVLGGTCRHLGSLPFEVCGKTGTAQNRGQDHSVFMGFAPMNNPRIALSVYVENGGFGAEFAVPMAGVMIEQYLNGKLSPAREQEAAVLQKRRIAYGSNNR